MRIGVAATFTADPIADSIRFWARELDLAASVEIAPYNQVFQQLLDPSSLFATNSRGVNVVLLRPEDWERSDEQPLTLAPLAPETAKRMDGHVQELTRAASGFALAGRAPLLIVFAPASPAARADSGRVDLASRMEAALADATRTTPGLHVIGSSEVFKTYPVVEYYDRESDILGHVPYTPAGFAALGTLVARHIWSLVGPPYKVVVVDCDNTLWKGVCGEDGAAGVVLDAPRRALQEALVAQHDGGRLLCLCSKNAEADVMEVFDQRSDMALRREHLVSWRINWKPKSENLRALAAELNLGLDSFVFLDDDPVECAEVAAHCPEVLVLPLPSDGAIAIFLEHVWAFDRRGSTEEDRRRTALYKEEAARTRLREATLDFHEFLAALDLAVTIGPVGPQHVARASQLTQRTNQFNCTTRRRSEAEIAALAAEGLEGLVVEVADRFGDYGLVGVVIFGVRGDALHVETFLMSCRALGRGAEHRVVARLAEVAKARGARWVEVRFLPTAKNRPALEFLESIGEGYREPLETGACYRIPVDVAAALRVKAASVVAADSFTDSVSPSGESASAGRARLTLRRIATELHEPTLILAAIESCHSRTPSGAAGSPGPTVLEAFLSEVWARALGVDTVGVRDDLVALGATPALSLAIGQWLHEVLGIQTTQGGLGAGATVKQMAAAIARAATPGLDLDAIVETVREVDRLPEGEVEALLANREAPIEVDAAEYRRLDLDWLPGHDGQALVSSRASGIVRSFPIEIAQMLAECREFRTLEAHAGRFAARALQGLDEAFIARHLADAAAAGLLVSRGALVQRCVEAAIPETPTARITSIGLITMNRVDGLNRALESYIRNCRDHGRTIDFVVSDDSPDAQVRERYRTTLRSLGQRYGVPIYYAGLEEKHAFARILVDKGGVPREVVDDALFGAHTGVYTGGANHNALDLHTIGEAIFYADDDTVCRVGRRTDSMGNDGGVALVGGRDPSDYWIFSDEAALRREVSFVEEDLVGFHEQMLGRRGAAVVAERAAAGVDVSALDAAVLQRLERGGTIRATFPGLVGDCAWGAPFWYGDEPMGFLLMDGASHDRLVASEPGYRAALCSRQLVRVVPRLTIADATFGMGAFLGLDGRRLLPPRPSNTRGDDVIFARLLWMCAPDTLYGHLPRTLAHAPVDTRQFWPGELFRTARGFDLTKLILACLGGASLDPGPQDDRDRLRALGRHLIEVGSLASNEFDRYVRERMVRTIAAFAVKAHTLLVAHGGEPRYWADDVSRYLDLQFDSLGRDDYYVPLDLLRGRTPDEARALGQRLVHGLGELMHWWPDVTDLAKGWRASGRRLAERL